MNKKPCIDGYIRGNHFVVYNDYSVIAEDEAFRKCFERVMEYIKAHDPSPVFKKYGDFTHWLTSIGCEYFTFHVGCTNTGRDDIGCKFVVIRVDCDMLEGFSWRNLAGDLIINKSTLQKMPDDIREEALSVLDGHESCIAPMDLFDDIKVKVAPRFRRLVKMTIEHLGHEYKKHVSPCLHLNLVTQLSNHCDWFIPHTAYSYYDRRRRTCNAYLSWR